jgi:peptidyl-prolyl cis-trans isomerase C
LARTGFGNIGDLIAIGKSADARKLLNDASFRRRGVFIRDIYLMRDVVWQRAEASINEDMMRKYYYEKDGGDEEEFRVRQILVDTKIEADILKERLTRGDDFIDLAEAVSKDRDNVDLGYISKKRFAEMGSDFIFQLKRGQISAPTQCQSAPEKWCIFKVEDRRIQPNQFEAAKEQIQFLLTEQAAERITEQFQREANLRILN